MTNVRDNEAWLRDLRAGGEPRNAALADLQALLQRALPQGLSGLLSPQNPAFEPFIEDTVQQTLLRAVNPEAPVVLQTGRQ